MVPYIVPSREFIEYMKQKHVKRVIDAGIDAIYMEEPEFWARAGYSDAFKEEWQAYYGFPWRAQHESPENTYLANKLKYHCITGLWTKYLPLPKLMAGVKVWMYAVMCLPIRW